MSAYIDNVAMLEAFVPVGDSKEHKLDSRQKMLYLRTENTFKEAASDIVEYVEASDKRDMAIKALYAARELALEAVVHGAPNRNIQTQKVEVETKKKKRF